ncbi:MAG: TetR/AcrR family transcriptional regulator [Chrysiogenales bacterium]|nr:MAG: TetR/AcrR family transcriptional regulator [Chrysiogenales bacterium]
MAVIPKEEKAKKKKKIIIEALKRLLDREVYSRITVQEIADEAGSSKGGILHYFPTKEDIYLELIEEIFTEFVRAHSSILEWELGTEEVAPISALVGAENFIIEKRNIKMIMNIILYAFEEEKIMKIVSKYMRLHRNFYDNIISQLTNADKSRRKSDLSSKYLSRITQTIVLFIGLLESIDPSDPGEMDYLEIVKFVTTLLRA